MATATMGVSSVDRLARSKRPTVERTEIHIPPAPVFPIEAVTGDPRMRVQAVAAFNNALQKWRNDAWSIEAPFVPDAELQADVATLEDTMAKLVTKLDRAAVDIRRAEASITTISTNVTNIDNSITTIDNQITVIESNSITGTGIVQANGTGPPTAIIGTQGHVPYWNASGPPYLSATSPIYTDGTNVGIGTDLPVFLLDLGLSGTTAGVIRLAGSASGNVIIQTAAAAGAWTLTLPTTDGAANEFLKTDGTGVTSWSSVVLTTDVTGLLPTANGGTNHGVWTPGSVIFAGAGGLLLTEDNANLFYDDANNLFGVGTALPVTELTVVSTSAADPRGIMSAQYSTDAVGARFHFRKARGTEALPTTVVTGDVIGRIRFSGYDGANYLQMGSIDVGSSGTIGATRVPTYMSFSVATDAAPSVFTERMRIISSGNVGIGIAAPVHKVDILGTAAGVDTFMRIGSTAGNLDAGFLLYNVTDAADSWAFLRKDTGFFSITHSTGNFPSGTLSTRLRIETNGNVGVGPLVPIAKLHVNLEDAVVTVTDVLRLNHSLTGGTAANFGTGILLTGKTSTTNDSDMARIQTIWTDSTHATRTSALQFQTVNSAAALATWVEISGAGITRVSNTVSNPLDTNGRLMVVSNTLTTGTITGISTAARNDGPSTSALARGINADVIKNNTGSITVAAAIKAAVSNFNATGLIGTAYGLHIDTLNNSGTITNTYGVYVGDITTGTQTNTPYSFYASDANAYNAFFGNVAIGLAVPLSKLHLFNAGMTDVQLTFENGAGFGGLYMTTGPNRFILNSFFGALNLYAGNSLRIEMSSGGDTYIVNGGGTVTAFFNAVGNVGIGTGVTNPGALLDLGLAGTTLGVMRMAGSTSGNVTIQAQAIAGTWTLQLPIDDGAAGSILTSNGSGVSAWTTVLPIANGGTNTALSLTSNSIVYSNGTSYVHTDTNFTFVAAVSLLSLVRNTNASWDATFMTNADLTANANAAIQMAFQLYATDGTPLTQRVIYGKEQTWTAVATTHDGYFEIQTLLNGTATSALGLRSSGSVICGKDSTGTTRTDDYTYICQTNGVPTGVPTAFGNRVAMTFDPNTDTFYIYRGGWKGVVVV